MNMLEKILFVADYIEPNRKPLKEIEEIRKEAFVDLDRCLIHILSNILEYLRMKGQTIDEISEQTYRYYVQEEQ